MKLSSVVNYSWTTTTNWNAHTLGIQGKTSASGYSLLTFTGYAGSPSGGTGTSAVFRSGHTWVGSAASSSLQRPRPRAHGPAPDVLTWFFSRRWRRAAASLLERGRRRSGGREPFGPEP